MVAKLKEDKTMPNKHGTNREPHDRSSNQQQINNGTAAFEQTLKHNWSIQNI